MKSDNGETAGVSRWKLDNKGLQKELEDEVEVLEVEVEEGFKTQGAYFLFWWLDRGQEPMFDVDVDGFGIVG